MAEVTGLHDVFQQVKAIVYGIWRKRWYMIASAWIVTLIVWILVLSMPYRYQAEARVFVDTQTALPAIARNLGIDVDVLRQVDLVQRTLVTRPNLERIIQRSDYLDSLATTAKDKDDLVTYLQRNISVRSDDKSLFTIQFEMDDARLPDRQRAEVARTVVSNLVSAFLERNSEGGRQKTAEAEQFLENQVKEYANRLERADQLLATFRQENLIYLGGQSGYLQRLQNEQDRLRGTQREIIERKVSLQELESQMAAVPPTIQIATRSQAIPGQAKDPIDERIDEIEKRLDALRANDYTERHPDVVASTRTLNILLEQKKEQQEQIEAEFKAAAAAGKATTRANETSNPLYEKIYLEVVQGRQELAKLERRELEQQALVSEMTTRAKRVPETEAEEKRLSRDYNTLQQQYDELIEEREGLALKKSVEGADDNLTLQVVEPPVVPQSPSGPPRLLYMGFGIVAGLLSGVAVAFIMSQVKPIVVSVDQLRTHFDLPVLGGVTRMISEEDARRRSYEHLAFAGTCIGLFAGFFVLAVIDIFGLPDIGI